MRLEYFHISPSMAAGFYDIKYSMQCDGSKRWSDIIKCDQ